MSTQQTRNIVTLNNVRLSFPELFTPKMETDDNGNAKPNGKMKYSATFLLHKKTNAKDIAAIEAAVAQAKKDPKLAGDKRVPKVFFRDGSDKPHLEGYTGDVKFFTARKEHKPGQRGPGVVDQNLQELTPESGKPYAGCFVNARVEAYPYVHPKSGPGIAFGLLNVQFLRDGEPFGSNAGPAEEGFAAVPEDSVV